MTQPNPVVGVRWALERPMSSVPVKAKCECCNKADAETIINGHGWNPTSICYDCFNGDGKDCEACQKGDSWHDSGWAEMCPDCNGHGDLGDGLSPCQTCDGTGDVDW